MGKKELNNHQSMPRINELGGVLGRSILHFFVKYFGLWLIRLITFPVVCYYMIAFPKVRNHSMKYWSTLYPDQSKMTYLRQIYKHYATFGETLVDRLNPSVQIENKESDLLVKDELQNNHGLILLCSHMGGYNFFRFDLDDHLVHIMMYGNEKERGVNKFSMFDRSNERNIRFINSMEANVVFRLHHILEGEGIVAVMGDRTTDNSPRYNKTVKLAGLEVTIPLSPWYLAYNTGATIIVSFIIKQKRSLYHYITKEPIKVLPVEGRKKREVIDQSISCYIDYLREMIIKYPDQWFNFRN